MLDFLSTLFQSLIPLWEMSLTAAYAAVVVIVLRLLLKKRAPKQVLCLLWLVVFARLLIPVSLESPLSIVPNALPGQEQQSFGTPTGTPVVPQPPVQDGTPNQPTGGAAIPVIDNPTSSALSVPDGANSGLPQQNAKPGPLWKTAAAGVWLAGALAMGGWALISYLRLRRRLFDAIRAEDGAWEHPAVESPFILGIFRPRIYLPIGLVGQPRKFILCHEHAHLRRLDHIIKPVCWAALALHWFNPMVWAAFLLMSRDIESACDEAVVRRLGVEVKADYSTTLLALATKSRTPAPCPLAFDEGDAKGRIQNVLRYRRPALWVIAVSAIAAVLAAVCLLTDPVTAKEGSEGDPAPDITVAQPPEDEPSPDPAPSQTPENHLADTLLDPWMRKVLDGEQDFIGENFIGEAGQNFNISRLNPMFYGNPDEMPAVTMSELAIIDLDRDGINELVICFREQIRYVDYLMILHCQGDNVYGYAPVWLFTGSLKADGTFDCGLGAGSWGISSAQFTENGIERYGITWVDCDSIDGIDEQSCYVDGRKATQAEFEAAITAHNAKAEPNWYTYENGVLTPCLSNSMELPGQTGLSAPAPYPVEPTPKMLKLDGMEAILFEGAYAAYWSETGASFAELPRVVLPYVEIYGTYERDGITYYVGNLMYHIHYYDEEARAYETEPGTIYVPCRIGVTSNGDTGAEYVLIPPDGNGYYPAVQKIIGPLKELNDAYDSGVFIGLTPLYSLPNLNDMWAAYQQTAA